MILAIACPDDRSVSRMWIVMVRKCMQEIALNAFGRSFQEAYSIGPIPARFVPYSIRFAVFAHLTIPHRPHSNRNEARILFNKYNIVLCLFELFIHMNERAIMGKSSTTTLSVCVCVCVCVCVPLM